LEAIILAGGKATRMGDALGGRPKALVEIAGRPLMGYQVHRLAKAGVGRVIVACAVGQGELFERELSGYGAEIVVSEEPEQYGRGGGITSGSAAPTVGEVDRDRFRAQPDRGP